MLLRADEWAEGRAADFTHNPSTPVDLKYAATMTRLDTAISDLGGASAIQQGGDFGEETEQQRMLRSDLEDTLRDVNRTAAAIAEETANPSIMDRFRMPSGSGDMMLRTKLTAFADAIVELNLAAAFAEHGLTVTEADLRQMAQDFNESEGEQGEALGGRAGATASIPVILRGGRSAVKTLNAIFHNTYKNDAAKLGAWKTVSRVQRDNSNGGGETPPPNPTP